MTDKSYRKMFIMEGPLESWYGFDERGVNIEGVDLQFYIESALNTRDRQGDVIFPGTYRLTLERVGTIRHRWVRSDDPDDQAFFEEDLPTCCQGQSNKGFEFECPTCDTWWLEIDGKVEE